MRNKEKRRIILIFAVLLIMVTGMCACNKKDEATDISYDDTYDVLHVDSVEEKGIDYGKYEIADSDGKSNKSSSADNAGDSKGAGSDKGNTDDAGIGSNNDDNGKNAGDSNSSNVGKKSVADKGGAGKKDSDKKENNNKDSNVNKDDGNISSSSSQSSGNNNGNPTDNGVPAPSEPQDAAVDKSKVYKCSLLIECKAVLSAVDSLDSKKLALIPEDGIILEKQDIEFCEGESAFDVLLRETRNEKIHMEYSHTPIYNSSYIEGIANLYEFDCGELSGWVYSVNDQSPEYGISRYSLRDGDVIHLEYTLDRK